VSRCAEFEDRFVTLGLNYARHRRPPLRAMEIRDALAYLRATVNRPTTSL
jgi:hypothetical protein